MMHRPNVAFFGDYSIRWHCLSSIKQPTLCPIKAPFSMSIVFVCLPCIYKLNSTSHIYRYTSSSSASVI